ncbi:MAG: chemotaxis protein CheA [Planctomycetes bacterium]|nr:chemotaxis protein CheA [Planctomycetota bacterium]
MQPEQTQSDELLAGFCEESLDLLQGLPEKLSEFSVDPTDSEAINVIFRSVHTIKGNAGFFGLTTVKEFAHSLEDAFDEIRQGQTLLEEELSRYLVEGLDTLGEMIIQVQENDKDAPTEEQHATLLQKIKSLCSLSQVDSAEKQLLIEVLQLADEIAATQLPQAIDWSVRLRAMADTTADEEHSENEEETSEGEELSVESLEGARFECAGVEVTDQVEPLLSLFLLVEKDTYQQKDGEAFLRSLDAFAQWTEQQQQADLTAELQAAREDFHTIFSSPLDIDSMLLSVVWQRLGPTLAELRRKEIATPLPDISANEASESPAAKPEATKEPSAKVRYLRVREDRVDDFLDDVSSLFITCERLKDLQTRMAAHLKMHDMVDEMRQINASLSGQSTALQRSVVELRKVPVRGLFSKFPRVARSLATKLGKQLNVHLTGEEIEIDKSLVEDLDGPLMHMIRNVCDHGIEAPEERQARGASADGNLHMGCSLTKTHVIITIEDDGRGVDPDRLRTKAVEHGLFGAEEAAALSDQQAVELIFHPGFSTAQQVSEISGRGVGLDVVRTRLREYEGDVSVKSTVGQGTTFCLEIPIRRSVVVIDGLLVRQGGITFVIPFEHIHEILRIKPDDMNLAQGRLVASIRNELCAAVGLDEILELDAPELTDDEPREGVLIKSKTGALFLMVESVLAQRKVVVNDLAFAISDSETISGVAQLGAGKLALVLNVPELVNAAARSDAGGFEYAPPMAKH